MEDERNNEASNPDTSSELVELKIKTLDSQIFSFHVDKDMPVSLFKEKVADDIGVPVGQQRLICRGKLLKDDHLLSEYHVENGHTLHLVERQASQSHMSTDASAGETNGSPSLQAASDQANNAGTPGNRVGQIPQGGVLGTLGSSEQSEVAGPDLTRIIGAVLNSFGVNGQPFINTTSSSPRMVNTNEMEEVYFAKEKELSRKYQYFVSVNLDRNRVQVNEADLMQAGHPFQFPPLGIQLPLPATIPLPSLASPIPDSLNTSLDFMNRMERVLSQNGHLQNMSSVDSSDLHRVELPSDTRGLPSPEALVIIMRRVEQLLNSYAIPDLSRLAGRLDKERDSSDPSIRGQVQTELVQVGLSTQHFGALLLELGRAILTLQMGESPLESSLNAGPAVYISSSGPNPIMVQPFPMQTSSLFAGANASPNPINSGLGGIGSAPRHINIHIHAASGGSGNGEGRHGEQSTSSSPVAYSSVRSSPLRNVTAPAAMPPRPTPATVSNTTQSNGAISSSQALSELSLSSLLTELNSRLTNLAGNVQGENLVPSGNAQQYNINRPRDPTVSGLPANGNLKDPFWGGGSASSRGTAVRFSDECGNAAPLGLGMEGLETKRGGNKNTTSSSRGSSMNGMDGIATSSSGNIVSQLFENPALMNSLISGVSSETNFGSPDMFDSLMQQFTQNPQIMNAIGQFAQHPNNQELGGLFSKLGSGQSGGIDMTQMVQQMTPVVSQALSQGPNSYGPTHQSNRQFEGRTSSTTDKHNDNQFQVDIEEWIKSMDEFTSPVDIFHGMVEGAWQMLNGGVTCTEELLDELCSNEDLANEYARMLKHDIHQRFQDTA